MKNKRIVFDKNNIDYKLIDNIVYSGKGVDIYIQSADYDGVEMTIEQLDELSPDFAMESKTN